MTAKQAKKQTIKMAESIVPKYAWDRIHNAQSLGKFKTTVDDLKTKEVKALQLLGYEVEDFWVSWENA